MTLKSSQANTVTIKFFVDDPPPLSVSFAQGGKTREGLLSG
jgi:hypothetical protein